MATLTSSWIKRLRWLSSRGSIVIAVYLGIKLLKKFREWKQRKDFFDAQDVPRVKGSGPFEIFGIIPEVRKNFHRLYDWKLNNNRKLNARTYAITLALSESHMSMLSTSDPEVVKHILKDQFNIYLKSDKLVQFLYDLVGDGIFGINHSELAPDGGILWKYQRKAFSKIFTQNQFQGFMTDVFTEHATKMVRVLNRKIQTNPVIEMESMFGRFTLDSIGKIAMGVDLDTINQEDLPFCKAFDDVQRNMGKRFVTPFWEKLGSLIPNERQIKKDMKILDDFIYKVIDEKRLSLSKNISTNHRDEDVLAFFIKEQQRQMKFGVKEGEPVITDKLLRGIVTSLFLAGRDTTKLTLSFTFITLAQRQDIQNKVVDEIKKILNDRKGSSLLNVEDEAFIPSVDELDRMPYLEALVYEVVRLYPAVPTDSKMSQKEDVLPNGIKVMPGTSISYEPYVMARMPEIWGPDAAEMKPERWLAMDQKPDAFTMCAWQAGRRECLGKRMSVLEVSQLTASLVKAYQFDALPDHEYTWAPGITMNVKNGVPLKLTPRKW